MSEDLLPMEAYAPTPDPQRAWPAGPAVAGAVYTFPGRETFGEGEMVAMTMDTWLNFGTDMERFRRTAEQQDKRIRELLGENAGLSTRLAELQTKHSNLREATRAQRLSEMEREIVLPPGSGQLQIPNLKR